MDKMNQSFVFYLGSQVFLSAVLQARDDSSERGFRKQFASSGGVLTFYIETGIFPDRVCSMMPAAFWPCCVFYTAIRQD